MARPENTAAEIKLVAFDLDGTLLRGETVAQVLARAIGRAERLEEFGQLTEPDVIRRACEEMVDWYAEHGVETLTAKLGNAVLAPGAREGFALLHENGIVTTIVSLTWDFAVAHFAKEFGAFSSLGSRWHPNGIEYVWPEDKPRRVKEVAEELGLPLRQVAAVGDSWGDVPMLRVVGLPIFVGHHPPVELPGLVHLPGANLVDVARCVLSYPR